jgi:uncharacterized protein YecT (DUF1311 family)
MRTVLAALSIVSVILGPAAYAQADSKHPIDVQLVLCLQDSLSTAGMRECCYTALDAWDAEMNKTYAALLEVLSPEGQSALRDAQVAWSAFRDKQFELNYQFYMEELQGTMYHVMASHANMEVVKDRALGLKAMLDTLRE